MPLSFLKYLYHYRFLLGLIKLDILIAEHRHNMVELWDVSVQPDRHSRLYILKYIGMCCIHVCKLLFVCLSVIYAMFNIQSPLLKHGPYL